MRRGCEKVKEDRERGFKEELEKKMGEGEYQNVFSSFLTLPPAACAIASVKGPPRINI